MLKIQRSGNGVTLIALIGRTETEHVVEVQDLLAAEPAGRHVVLDLKKLTLAGKSEIDFLAECEGRGVTLANCAPYIREWITHVQNESRNDV